MERLVDRSGGVAGPVPFDLAAAVAAQLQRIVGCRPDMGAPGVRLDDFGMPAVVELGVGRRDGEAYGARLLDAIARYEPRLREVRLEWLPTGRALGPRKLVVHGCLIEGGEEPRAFRFEMPAEDARA
jgi:predicted component of type VI protein secretion system